MAVKFPPPPDMGRDNYRLNRWLLELQSILNDAGLIDPASVVDLPPAYTQIGENTTDIANLVGVVNALIEIVAVNTVDIATLQTQMLALTGRVTALEARPQVRNGAGGPAAGLGNVNDWYADTAAGGIYVKTAAATWTVVA